MERDIVDRVIKALATDRYAREVMRKVIHKNDGKPPQKVDDAQLIKVYDRSDDGKAIAKPAHVRELVRLGGPTNFARHYDIPLSTVKHRIGELGISPSDYR